jgi:HPt (histidine-containing phosphotransfer) domain-containing protein
MGHSSGALSEVNLPELLDRVGGDSDLLREITTIFLEEYPQLLEDIRSAVARCDDHLLERSAHSLKGSVSNFGAESATAAAYSLEQLGRQKDAASAAGQLQKLEAELSALLPPLRAILTNI